MDSLLIYSPPHFIVPNKEPQYEGGVRFIYVLDFNFYVKIYWSQVVNRRKRGRGRKKEEKEGREGDSIKKTKRPNLSPSF